MAEAEQVQTTGTEEVEQSLYAKRQKIYPREVHGMFAALRTSGVLALLGGVARFEPGYDIGRDHHGRE